ncbi:Microprocessor complex subunit dgcr8, partial [Cichlidogyrus casuarinus]
MQDGQLVKCKKEGIINPIGKSLLSVMHEYATNVLNKAPTYKDIGEDNGIFKVSISLGDNVVGYGSGKTKKIARCNAALQALKHSIPGVEKLFSQSEECAEKNEAIKTNGSSFVDMPPGGIVVGPSTDPNNQEENLSFFDSVSSQDSHVFDYSQRLSVPTPSALLKICLSRMCIPEKDIALTCEMRLSKHHVTMKLHDHIAK